MKKEFVVGYRYGQPITEEGVLIKTADPRITGRIYEVDGKYVVAGRDDENPPKWFNRLSEAIQYCQPNMRAW